MAKNLTENEREKEITTALQIELNGSSLLAAAEKSDVDELELKVENLRPVSDVEKSRCTENVATVAESEEQQVESKENDAKDTKNKDWVIYDFVIERRLGQGQYGKVYLAREKSTKYAYAMKKQVRDVITEILVWREILIQTDLCHKNIIRLYGYFIHRDYDVYLILEYAPNGNLRKKMRKQPDKRFDENTAARYILSCADALNYLHDLGFIHRDLKPENLLLGYNDELKIADFGLAINAQNQRRTTICGTPDYIPPEIMNGESYTKAVDLWSLGVLSYDMLVGEWAFKAKTEADQYWKRVKAQYNPCPEFLSKTAAHLIRRLIVVDPECRLSLLDVMKHPWIIANTQ